MPNSVCYLVDVLLLRLAGAFELLGTDWRPYKVPLKGFLAFEHFVVSSRLLTPLKERLSVTSHLGI